MDQSASDEHPACAAPKRGISGCADEPDGVLFHAGLRAFKGYGLVDTSINYNIPVFGSLRPWVKFDVFNLFDNLKLVAWNRTVRPDPASPVDSLGLRTGFLKGAAFGTADSHSDFPTAIAGVDGGRTFRVAFGFRF
ncbi:MAG TPA: hypothetical protein VGQ16_18260 [Vicinamibacterales bacterium]|nr:hypothetical protein [Vicinamibacterales bacterium]